MLSAVVVVAVALFASFYRRNDVVYGLTHAELNWQRPGELWLNMGLWKDGETFGEACKSLIGLVATQARFSENSLVLDVGNGCGDQDFYLMKDYPIKEIVGVNNEKIQVSVANKRLSEYPFAERVRFLLGNAVEPHTWTSIDGEGITRMEKFDAVLSVDSAYHFDTRSKFFHVVSRDLLKVGGRIALADIIGGTGSHAMRWFDAALFKFVLKGAHVPVENLWASTAEYQQQLAAEGFTDIEVLDITHLVFPGFISFLLKFDMEHPVRWSNVGTKLRYRLFTRALKYATDNQILRFVVAVATLGPRD
jgi:cyclopropane fatty-acyl-phospholipid synthase-like methyltransferase